MISLLRSLSRSFVAVFSLACLGLLAVGCDSNGGSGTDGSDSGSTQTFDVTIENVGALTPLLKSGAFTPDDENPTNDGNAGPLKPGEAFQFSFTTGTNELPGTGAAFSFASMFVQSNDVYYATTPGGIPLFDGNDDPISGDVTDQIALYDAGTEKDQKPGEGDNQAPRQSSPDTGPDENGTIVRLQDTDGDNALEDEGNDFEYPAVPQGVEVTVESQEDTDGGIKFTVTIKNVSGEENTTVNGKPLVLSPGSFAVHFDQTPQGDEVTYPGHTPGSAASDGIEDIAEDGTPDTHVSTLSGKTGVTVPFSPGAYAVHSDDIDFFSTGADASDGLERLAEDGKPEGASGAPGNLVGELTGVDGIKSVDAFGSGPLTPGNSVTFSVDATPGDRLSLATMYIQSNDLFYATNPDGIALFDSDDNPVSGEQTVRLYDAGSEADQEPGVGLDQAPRSGLDTGPSGEGNVTRVDGSDDGFSYPDTDNLITVTVTPQ